MGLPVKHYIVATNINDVVPEYLETGRFNPRPSVQTIANAMDVGNPSNFARILDLYDHSHRKICKAMDAWSYTDDDLRAIIGKVYGSTGYLLDPHGAAGYLALQDHSSRRPTLPRVFLETAHPAKFSQTVEQVVGTRIPIPEELKKVTEGRKLSIPLSKDYNEFKAYLAGAAG
jgi:threonine synthase